jgi:hypothetical protein
MDLDKMTGAKLVELHNRKRQPGHRFLLSKLATHFDIRGADCIQTDKLSSR